MPDELERNEELEQQLAAFGETLAERTGEPITATAGRRTVAAPRSRRRWAILGAAACLIVAVSGIATVVRDRQTTVAPSASIPADDGASSIEDLWANAVPAPDTPLDALQLDGATWTLVERRAFSYAVTDVMGCREQKESDALIGHQVVRERYQSAGDSWIGVRQVQYADSASARDRLGPLTDLSDCDELPLDTYEQLTLDAGAGVDVSGYRWNASTVLAFHAPNGHAVVVDVANGGRDDSLVAELVDRVGGLLRGELTPRSADETPNRLDDLVELVGDDPLDVTASGWEVFLQGVGPFDQSGWPVCRPGEADVAVANAPTLDAVYGQPEPDAFGISVQFVLEPDPDRRAALGRALIEPSECPPSSLIGQDIDPDIVDRAADGVWGRVGSEIATYVVAPPGPEAAPLIALIRGSATSPRTEELVGRAVAVLGGDADDDGDVDVPPSTSSPPFDVRATPADPLGLERDGWRLVERTNEAFDAGATEFPCPAVGEQLAAFDGSALVHDILTPPDSQGLDLDVEIIDVGTPEQGSLLAAAVGAVGECMASSQGAPVEFGELVDAGASWFRAGPDFALVTIVGDADTTIVLEIEGDEVGDALIDDLVARADQFLRHPFASAEPPGALPVTTTTVLQPTASGSVVVQPGAAVGERQREPEPGEVQLWVSNQSFADDPVRITIEIDGALAVDDAFAVEGQHNWISWFVSVCSPGPSPPTNQLIQLCCPSTANASSTASAPSISIVIRTGSSA
ncbi:MAG: hypothetical protein QNJ12_14800, partial [Ilumatobacter sp.]|uniref:hypothetical protein n=1 Tax=Ilumatobacter sp. TaxID=1967498 RepID=UPI0026167B91